MLYYSAVVTHLMLELMLLLGLAVDPEAETITGTCRGLQEKPVPCLLQEHPYGIKYVTDGEVVYQFRPVWWGVYDMSINGKPYKAASCSPKENDLICTNTFTFISDL